MVSFTAPHPDASQIDSARPEQPHRTQPCLEQDPLRELLWLQRRIPPGIELPGLQPQMKEEIQNLIRAELAAVEESIVSRIMAHWKTETRAELVSELTEVVRQLRIQDFKRKLATEIKITHDDGGLRLTNFETDNLDDVSAYAREPNLKSVPAVRSQQQRKVFAHTEPTNYGTQEIAVDEIDQIKRDIKDELKEELIWTLQEEVHAHVNCSDRNVAQSLSRAMTAASSDAGELNGSAWQFQCSCWDAVIFAFNGNMLHFMESVWMFFLMLFNVGVQSGFIITVSLSLARTSLDDETIEGYHLWRTNTGHAAKFYDPITEQSLVTRVCFGDSSVHLSEGQSMQISNINAYLEDNSPFNGPLLCSLALLAWILTLTSELQAVVGMIRSFRRVPRGMTSTTELCNRLVVSSVSCRRFVFVCHLAIFRVLIALSLLLVGSKYLAVTISIEDILLNAVALGFVLSIDELLYSALAPRKTKQFITSLQPLPFGSSVSRFGFDAHVCVTLILIIGFFMGVVLLFIVPEQANMKKAKRELCGGAQEFIFSFPKMGAVVWADTARAVSLEQTLQALQKTNRYKILRKAIGIEAASTDVDVSMHKLRHATGGGWNVVDMEHWILRTVGTQLNAACEDILNRSRVVDTITFYARASLRDLSGNQSIALCGDARLHCGRYSTLGTLMRLYCPGTCGCADPMSELALVTPVDGCPATCTEQARWLHSKYTAPCVDRLLYTPSGQLDSVWMAFLTSWRIGVSGWSPVYVRVFLQYADEMEKNGCQGVAKILTQFGVSLCLENWLKPLAIFCPETCDCNKTRALYCPGACASFVKV